MKPTKEDLERANLIANAYQKEYGWRDGVYWLKQSIAQALAEARAEAVKEVLESKEIEALSGYVYAWSQSSNGEPVAKQIISEWEKFKQSIQGEGK